MEDKDVYEHIRQAISVAPQFRMDWFIRSRTAQELSRRCTILIKLIMKEFGIDENEKDVIPEETKEEMIAEVTGESDDEAVSSQPSMSQSSRKRGATSLLENIGTPAKGKRLNA